MNIEQESVVEFRCRPRRRGCGAGRWCVAFARRRIKGAACGRRRRTRLSFTWGRRASRRTGYPLPAGEELEVKIENPSKIHVVAEPAGNSQQIVTIAGDIAGETFTLTLEGHPTAPIAVDAAAGTVEDALEVLPNIGAGNVSVSGDAGGPFTVEFTGDLAKTDLPLLVGSDGGINEKQDCGDCQARRPATNWC